MSNIFVHIKCVCVSNKRGLFTLVYIVKKKHMKIIKSERLHYANLLFIIRLLEHFTTEYTILQTY